MHLEICDHGMIEKAVFHATGSDCLIQYSDPQDNSPGFIHCVAS